MSTPMQMKRLRNAAVYEYFDDDDLYMVTLWCVEFGNWAAEIFVNGASITRVFADTREDCYENAVDAVMSEMSSRQQEGN